MTDTQKPRIVCGMILGEASESDDDSDTGPDPSTMVPFIKPQDNKVPLPVLKKTTKHKLKYNTLLHHKLRESNISFLNNMVRIAEQPLQRSNNNLQDALHLQSKTRTHLHETPRHLHQLSIALVGLQDRLPSICNAKILPNFLH